MPVSDAFVVGEDWISEHYFTTDAKSQSFHVKVLSRRKEWDAEEVTTARDRFLEARGTIEQTLNGLLAATDAEQTAESRVLDKDTLDRTAKLHDELVSILGFHTGEYVLDPRGPLTSVWTQGLTGAAPLVIISAAPAETVDDLLTKEGRTLGEAYLTEDDTPITSVSRLLSHLFVADDAPRFALVLAGRWALVAEQERWPEGRYLAVDLQVVAERNDAKRGGEIDRALTCLEAHSLGPDADGDIWWTAVLEESVKHTVGVSQDLREGVRLSIEIIANEVVRRRAAKGLDPLPQEEAQPLAVQSLRYLYRILFLLYAEASPELGVLPVGATEYDKGYSLDRLRELTLVDLHSEQGRNGKHLYESLEVLFRLVDKGHGYSAEPGPSDGAEQASGLVFHPLRADLFEAEAISHIGKVGLGNEALQRVLRHLLLSKQVKGQDRGFISYVELGINQLGAVYEGLMSYTGFFAEEDLFEVAKGGDPSKGSWLVPVTRSDHLDRNDFVMAEDEATSERKPVRHAKGTFVFRLSGRERQQSASYYTPEVLTRFTVSQALAELLDQDGHRTTAEEILGLSICEPAMGSGAFAIEAVRQLAAQYLARRQDELGERIDPDEYPQELQRVKAYIALHQVHGVDLNSTAVELAEVSLWLDTMVRGLEAPWFGLRLRRGNSLIGARRATYSQSQVKDKSWLKVTPQGVPLTELAENIEHGRAFSATSSRIHHFLLPADGWGSATEVPRDVRDLAPHEVAALKVWRRSVKAKPTTKQLQQLTALGERVEKLWQFALRRLRIAEAESSRTIPLWGLEMAEHSPAVSREQIEESLADEDGAYRRLKLVMDLWCALWFWPLTEIGVRPPALTEWIAACEAILGVPPQSKNRWMETFSGDASTWDGLNAEEVDDLNWAGAQSTAAMREKHPWVVVGERVAQQQGFFHWELDFATVFTKGGFDLQLGNPPWVRPAADVDALLAEGDPWWQLAVKPSETQRGIRREATLALEGVRPLLLDGTVDTIGIREFVGSSINYPHLAGLQPDLYRCFMSQVWAHVSNAGFASLIHPESHFTEERAGRLRSATYRRLRRHWQFINELVLFDIDHHNPYGVHVYGAAGEVQFLQATGLYHPETAERSLRHSGEGPEPGLKDPDGNWDLRPHRGRIIEVDGAILETWRDVLEEPSAPAIQTRMLYTVNLAASSVLNTLSRSARIDSLGFEFSPGWHEKSDRVKGRFTSRWGEAEWKDAILQGPHLHVGTPLYKFPNETMKHNLDWTATDFEALATDALPITAYKPAGNRAVYEAAYTHWQDKNDEDVVYPARDYYRIAWRAMAANTGERTLTPAVIPPGAGHINGVFCVGAPERITLVPIVAGVAASLLSDFSVRAAPKSGIYQAVFDRLVLPPIDHPLMASLCLRTLRLNSVTDAYADLWSACWVDEFAGDQPILIGRASQGLTAEWTADTPLRRAVDRRNALVEIDALMALMLGVSIDDLCTIYRTQFAVLYGYDRKEYTYDANGRLVPNSVLSVWRKKGSAITEEERTSVHPGSGVEYTYELPFGTLDREADMRTAYAEFERRLAEKTKGQ
jgi:hypothetical protein